MISFEVQKAKLIRTSAEELTSGMTRSVICEFKFSPDWDGYAVTITFTAGAVSKTASFYEGNKYYVPWECLAVPNQALTVGVYGVMNSGGDTMVLPTVYAYVGMIQKGTDPDAPSSAEPTPSLTDQILTSSKAAETAAEALRSDAAAGKFNGATFTPAISDTCVLSWTNDKGKENPASVTIKGDAGAAGPQGEKGDTGATGATGADGKGLEFIWGSGDQANTLGVRREGESAYAYSAVLKGEKGDTGAAGTNGADGADGAAAAVAVGITTTGAAGSDALVSNSGTSSAAVLNFTIPKGAKGDTGAAGPQGPKGDTGAAGPPGEKGDTGAQGAAGAAGAAATVSIGATATGAAGTSAAVTNSGTSSAAVLNFTIPKGAKGDTGAAGPQGEKGDTGAQGAAGAAGAAGAGVPTGGTAGQLLTKSGSADYDTAWSDNTCKPVYTSGASSGYVDFGSMVLFGGLASLTTGTVGGKSISITLPVAIKRIIAATASPTNGIDVINQCGFTGFSSSTARTSVTLEFWLSSAVSNTYYFSYLLLAEKA